MANISYCGNANDDDVSFVLKMLCCAAYGWLHYVLFNLGIILTRTNSTFFLSFFYYTGMRGPVLHQRWRRRQPNASTYHAMGQASWITSEYFVKGTVLEYAHEPTYGNEW